MYQNFIEFTKVLKAKAKNLMIEFNFQIMLPKFYSPDQDLLDNL